MRMFEWNDARLRLHIYIPMHRVRAIAGGRLFCFSRFTLLRSTEEPRFIFSFGFRMRHSDTWSWRLETGVPWTKVWSSGDLWLSPGGEASHPFTGPAQGIYCFRTGAGKRLYFWEGSRWLVNADNCACDPDMDGPSITATSSIRQQEYGP